MLSFLLQFLPTLPPPPHLYPHPTLWFSPSLPFPLSQTSRNKTITKTKENENKDRETNKKKRKNSQTKPKIIYKKHSVYFVLTNYSWSGPVTQEYSWYTQWHYIGEIGLIFHFQVGNNYKYLLVHFPFSSLAFCLGWTCAALVRVVTVSVSSDVYKSCCIWKMLFP